MGVGEGLKVYPLAVIAPGFRYRADEEGDGRRWDLEVEDSRPGFRAERANSRVA